MTMFQIMAHYLNMIHLKMERYTENEDKDTDIFGEQEDEDLVNKL